MIEPLFPGVLLTEVAFSAKPIEGVSTSNSAFVGMTSLERLARTSTDEPPAWTETNESDPGLPLPELFAWLGESIAYRAEQNFEHFVPHTVLGTGVASGFAVGAGHAGAPTVAPGEAVGPDGRALGSNPQLKYVNLRRYFAYLNESIGKGIQFAVFEPDSEALWQNVRAAVSDFLFREWQSGALQGVRPEEAYFVKCDRSTMTQDDLDNGRLVMLVGVATLKPSEFVILRIAAMTAAA